MGKNCQLSLERQLSLYNVKGHFLTDHGSRLNVHPVKEYMIDLSFVPLEVLTFSSILKMRMDRRKTSEEHVTDMHKLDHSITKWQKYAYANSERSGKETALPLIPKIKRNIHDNQSSNNEPSIISIGPYYHRAPAVQRMQRMKYECLYFILSMDNENNLADYIKAMKGIEQHARSYYDDEINMETDEILKMLLLDGCFVLVALFGFSDVVSATMEVSKVNFNTLQKETETSFTKTDDTIIDIDSNRVNPNQSIQNNIAHESNDQEGHTRMWYSHFLWNDALILDNQIPFCVLQRIHDTFVGGKCSTLLLHKSAIKFMGHMIKCNQKAVRHFEEQMMFHHLLHLCHAYLSPTKEVSQQATQLDLVSGSFHLIENHGNLKQNPWRQATEYHQAGIVLAKKEPCDDSAHSLLDIVFCNGILHILCLTIVHTITKCLLQNLVAFESSCPEFGNYIAAYVLFWSKFISMTEDVELLTEKGIIEQQANSDAQVLNIFKALSEDVSFDFNCNHYLKPLSYTLEAHYQRRRSKLKALLGSINLKRRSKCDIHQPLRAKFYY